MTPFVYPTFPETDAFDILRNNRRRAVIEELRERGGSTTLRELSEEIAAAESGESPPPTGLRESVYNSLHQTHLPKLDREDVIEYDRNRKTVSLQPRARGLDVYMEVVTAYGITWADFYRLLGTLGLFAVIATLIGIPELGSVPPLLVASGFLALIGLSTAYELIAQRSITLRSFLSESDD